MDLSTRLWGITTEFVGFIPQSFVLRPVVLGWILIYRKWAIGLCKGRSLERSLGQRLHRKDDVGAGCQDRRASSSWLYDGHSVVVRSVGLAAAATAADDHDDDKDKTAANHSSLTHGRHVMPPGKDTWIFWKKENVYKLIYQCKLWFSRGTSSNFSSLI